MFPGNARLLETKTISVWVLDRWMGELMNDNFLLFDFEFIPHGFGLVMELASVCWVTVSSKFIFI